MSISNVEAFYKRLTSDEAFRQQVENAQSKDECSQIVKAAGYHFTQEELAKYTSDLMGTENSEGEIQELDEKELATVFGGWIGRGPIMMYGSVMRE
jgi:predicted ribosomally synthesized peptide with nif11-like leader